MNDDKFLIDFWIILLVMVFMVIMPLTYIFHPGFKSAIDEGRIYEEQETTPELRRFTLLHMNPPERFYVTLEDVQTKQVYPSIYVTKRCSRYAQNKLRSEYNLLVVYKGDNKRIVFKNLYEAFCSGT